MKPFQTILIGACVFFGIAGILIFATMGGVSKDTIVTAPKVIIWGTLPEVTFTRFIQSQNELQEGILNASYRYVDPIVFDQQLLTAQADGGGPDMIIVSSEDLWKKKDRIAQIPVSSYPDRTFKDTFVEAGEELRATSGYLGLPLLIDPMVMYWNRDLFNEKGIAVPPRSWEEIAGLVETLSRVDESLGVSQAAIAMGEFRNIKNAKYILASLLFQAQNPITNLTINDSTLVDELRVELNKRYDTSNPQSAVSFFNQFSDQSKNTYTWNRSLPESLEMFLTGSLSLYLGMSSELSNIQSRNPNLNFDVALFPQLKNSKNPSVYSTMYVMALGKNSVNKAEAFRVMGVLTQPVVQQSLGTAMKLASVRRDVLAVPTADPFLSQINLQAIQSQIWLDPNKDITDTIFANMIESITSGRMSTSEAINQAGEEIERVIGK